MNTEQVAVYRINGKTVSAPVQVVRGEQWVNGVQLTKLQKDAEWLNVFSKEKRSV